MTNPATQPLEELEARVIRRYLELTHIDWPLPEDIFDPKEWLDSLGRDTIANTIPAEYQFPREQWATLPNRRRIALIIVDRSLDLWDTMTDEQRSQVAFLLSYGGRERIA